MIFFFFIGNKERLIHFAINNIKWQVGFYAGVFSVLYYCREIFLQKIAARQAYNASQRDAL